MGVYKPHSYLKMPVQVLYRVKENENLKILLDYYINQKFMFHNPSNLRVHL